MIVTQFAATTKCNGLVFGRMQLRMRGINSPHLRGKQCDLASISPRLESLYDPPQKLLLAVLNAGGYCNSTLRGPPEGSELESVLVLFCQPGEVRERPFSQWLSPSKTSSDTKRMDLI